MSVFKDKLATLSQTFELATEFDGSALSERLRTTQRQQFIAVGSGGSAVAAAFVRRCRSTVKFGPTTVATPMELILGDMEVGGADVWLFSAGASNPDIEAAHRYCNAEGAGRVTLVTTRADGKISLALEADPQGAVIALPVADPKDGFLATHSLISTTTALFLAVTSLVDEDQTKELSVAVRQGSLLSLAEGSRARVAVQNFQPGDTLLVLHDPQAAPIAVLLETSLWETGIAAVQRVDFRNFAHGRHVWLARYPDRTFVLSITTRESRSIWEGISAAIPAEVRRGSMDLGNAGRLQTAISVAAGLAIVDELGRAQGIDPGRPGRGDFAPAIYAHRGLVELVNDQTRAITHKRAANLLTDPASDRGVCLLSTGKAHRDRLEAAEFGALALDYDGTIVATDRRLSPPAEELVAELVRLLDAGIRLGIATGRGGSAGEALRSALPPRLHERVLMGYYNGAHLLPLSIPLEESPPAADPHVAEVAAWLKDSGVAANHTWKAGAIQLTINCGSEDAGRISSELARHPAVAAGRLKTVRSQHSVDVVPKGTSKLRVVSALNERFGQNGLHVLAIGDSGSPVGNDYELLSSPMSISVNQVCGTIEGCWTLFGDGVTGPEALHQILSAIALESGRGRLGLQSLT